jgi:hypothetical protein
LGPIDTARVLQIKTGRWIMSRNTVTWHRYKLLNLNSRLRLLFVTTKRVTKTMMTILSRDGVTIDGFPTDDHIYGTL